MASDGGWFKTSSGTSRLHLAVASATAVAVAATVAVAAAAVARDPAARATAAKAMVARAMEAMAKADADSNFGLILAQLHRSPFMSFGGSPTGGG